MEIAISAIICSLIVFTLACYPHENNCGNFRTWLKGSLGFYLIDLIVGMNQLMFVKKNVRESGWLLLFMLVVLIGNTSWYIYGNVIYFDNEIVCSAASENPNVAHLVWFMIMIGYITMCKCCLITVFAAIAIPCIIIMYRQ